MIFGQGESSDSEFREHPGCVCARGYKYYMKSPTQDKSEWASMKIMKTYFDSHRDTNRDKWID